jgi:hypothetical protein
MAAVLSQNPEYLQDYQMVGDENVIWSKAAIDGN